MIETNRKGAYRTINEKDFIEVVEWTNGVGFDVSFSDRRQANFTWSEYIALLECIKEIDGDPEDDQ